MLRIGSTVVAGAAAAPIAKLGTKLMTAKPGPKKAFHPEVHFTGKHAFGHLMAKAKQEDWQALPMGDLMGAVGAFFLDTPYVNYTLDHSADEEFCIVNLQELDCVTFVETTLALSRVIKLGKETEAALPRQIELIRYRNGHCSGFCARLHYLSDWFYDNQKKGLITDYTQSLPGAVAASEHVALMSERPNEYKQLRKHPEWIPPIRQDEAAINSRIYYHIPKADVQAAEAQMQTGDIVAITTEAKILDCAHTGLCYRDEKGVLRFLHASQKHKKVYLDQELCEYLDGIHAFTGVMLARPIAPV
jgi:hypothetical protein